MKQDKGINSKKLAAVFSLALYDTLLFVAYILILYVFYRGGGKLDLAGLLMQSGLAAACIFGLRSLFKVYKQVWRYGGIQCYIRLLFSDGVACVLYTFLEMLLPIQHITKTQLLAFCCMNALTALAMRMLYRYAYKNGYLNNRLGKLLRWMLRFFSGNRVGTEVDSMVEKGSIAIIGAGNVGIGLAEDLRSNPKASFVPVAFIDTDSEKIGR